MNKGDLVPEFIFKRYKIENEKECLCCKAKITNDWTFSDCDDDRLRIESVCQSCNRNCCVSIPISAAEKIKWQGLVSGLLSAMEKQ